MYVCTMYNIYNTYNIPILPLQIVCASTLCILKSIFQYMIIMVKHKIAINHLEEQEKLKVYVTYKIQRFSRKYIILNQLQIQSLKGGNVCLINDELDTNDIWTLSSKKNCPITSNNTLIIMLRLVNSRLKLC